MPTLQDKQHMVQLVSGVLDVLCGLGSSLLLTAPLTWPHPLTTAATAVPVLTLVLRMLFADTVPCMLRMQ